MVIYVDVTCSFCGVIFGVEKTYHGVLERDKKEFFCTNGHSLRYSENEADRLRRERDRLQQRNAMLADEAEEARKAANNALKALKSEKTRHKNTKKRATAGVCLECNRTFTNVALHMKTCHSHGVKDDKIRVLPLP